MARDAQRSYGSFGDATFDVDDSTWHFTRDLTFRRVLIPLYAQHGTVEGRKAMEGHNPQHLPRSVRRERQIALLLHSYPEVRPAQLLLLGLVKVSEAVEAITLSHDPLKAEQICVTSIYNRSRHAKSNLVAWVSGETGSDVSIACLVPQRRGWPDEPAVRLNIPVTTKQATIYGPGAPVQQVCLAQAASDTPSVPLLAVRLLNQTKIFRVEIGPDRVIYELLFDVTAEDTAGVSHSYVAFNQYFVRQLAVIDTSGSWSVWEVGGKSLTRHEQVCSFASALKDSPDWTVRDDWFRIAWAGGPTAIAVATRSCIRVYDISNPESDGVLLKFGHNDREAWLLDMTSLPDVPNLLFVLTSVQIAVVRLNNSLTDDHHTLLWRIRHFADPDDLTMQLLVQKVDDDVLLFVRSKSEATKTFYHLIIDRDDGRLGAAGPFLFQSYALQGKQVNPGFQLLSVAVEHSAKDNGHDGSHQAHRNFDRQLMALIYADEGQGLRSEICCLAQSHDEARDLQAPTQMSAVGKRRRKRALQDEAFIVDTLSSEEEHEEQSQPVSAFARLRRGSHQQKTHFTRTQDISKLRRLVTASLDTDTVDLTATLEAVRSLCTSNDQLGGSVTQILSSADDGLVTVSDLEQATAFLQQLREACNIVASRSDENGDDAESSDTTTRGVPTTKTIAEMIHEGDPSALYDSIVSTWITPLAEDISGEIRLAKDGLARHVAAEICLASHVVHNKVVNSQGTDSQDLQDSQVSAVGMVRQDLTPQPDTEDGDVVSTPLSRPTPSVASSSSRLSSIYQVPRYTIPDHIAVTERLPRRLRRAKQRILVQWEVGTDPEDYDFEAFDRRIARQVQDEDLDVELTDKERLRLKRASARYARRQQEEAAAIQSQRMASQVPEVVLSASQPIPIRSRNEPSQFSSQMATSQAVPGRYGDTMPLKRKRKQGF